MKRLLLAITVAALGVFLMVMLIAETAGAQCGCELAHECLGQDAQVTPTGNPADPFYVWDADLGYARYLPGMNLRNSCRYEGGYYYLTEDGTWEWWACEYRMPWEASEEGELS